MGSTACETSTQILLGVCPTHQDTPKGSPYLCTQLGASPLPPPHHSSQEVVPSIVSTKYLHEWAAIREDPLKEPLVSDLLPHLSASTFPTPSNVLPITVPPIKTFQNLPLGGND